MRLFKVRSRQSLSWTRHLLSARRPSAMWALQEVPELMAGNLSPDRPCWRVYLQSGVISSQGTIKPSQWPQEPLHRLLSQQFSCRQEALQAIEIFSELYRPTSEAAAREVRGAEGEAPS